mmetsp:Transcript_10235/g.12416  ORF Transcript_10235/g.12416 Transcript_10235/m.12416 type:complete len:107 (+) Transcript_10235:109-429(+)|eukprot:CAMPEP_0114359140 /NCGR_PEP_ID=MMETSP0101-20121206/22792_1 /TAXON_ID=38822 ORGANISM="Pteridomonas danica, Strain PT" /NCGR_SAMPLE_ID=MMETSP0101 /ASSEMBLY_ACC=CAM_ASM_000211 /LENGTH=106 /DNA_ID=CAMNT_0001502531 /DNA_START=81 /DNA_END=401 /DNA_ORIENTATION=-
MANERDLSMGQKHFPEREGSKSSLGQICCCVGGHQKQKLIDSMLLANQALVKQVKMLEDEKKILKQNILSRDKTILQANKDMEVLQEEKVELLAVVERQQAQLADW